MLFVINQMVKSWRIQQRTYLYTLNLISINHNHLDMGATIARNTYTITL